MTKPIKSSVESPWFYTRKLKRFYIYKRFVPIVNLKFFYRNFYRKCNLCLKSPWSRLKIVYLTVRILLCVFDCVYLTVCIWIHTCAERTLTLKLPESQGTPSSEQARHLQFKWLQREFEKTHLVRKSFSPSDICF